MITLEQFEQFKADCKEEHDLWSNGTVNSYMAFRCLKELCQLAEIDVSSVDEKFEREVNEIARKYYLELRNRLGLSMSRKRVATR